MEWGDSQACFPEGALTLDPDCGTVAGARPKDLLSGFWGPAPRYGAGPRVLSARSFGRRSGFTVRDSPERRLPQENILLFPGPVSRKIVISKERRAEPSVGTDPARD